MINLKNHISTIYKNIPPFLLTEKAFSIVGEPEIIFSYFWPDSRQKEDCIVRLYEI